MFCIFIFNFHPVWYKYRHSWFVFIVFLEFVPHPFISNFQFIPSVLRSFYFLVFSFYFFLLLLVWPNTHVLPNVNLKSSVSATFLLVTSHKTHYQTHTGCVLHKNQPSNTSLHQTFSSPLSSALFPTIVSDNVFGILLLPS